jgi:superoxide dismutase, Cu-Zn family
MMRMIALMTACLVLGLPRFAVAQTAKAELKDPQGRVVASAALREVSGSLRVTLTASGLEPGVHGLHIHAVGKCEPPAFTSAGSHFNPYGKQHGRKNPRGAHAGDLPNLEVRAGGTASTEVVAPGVTLKEGEPGSLFRPGGTALIIHADPDDEMTDPTGNSGPRIACGVITKD